MSLVVALALTVLQEAPLPAALPERVTIAGKVREVGGGVGGASKVLLVLEDNHQVELHPASAGDEVELQRLAGARVRVIGVRGDPLIPAGDHVRVDRYEILDVGGGITPRIGRIAELTLDGKVRLLFAGEDGVAELLPESWNLKMKRHVGAKLWVAGNRSEVKGELTPSRFAILRPVPKADPAVEEKTP